MAYPKFKYWLLIGARMYAPDPAMPAFFQPAFFQID